MEQEKKLHIKHVEIWIILLIIALLAAVGGITYAFINMGQDDYKPGYYQITGLAKENIPHYDDSYTYLYYLDGNARDITSKMEEVQKHYSDALSSIYAALDEEKEYEGISSISNLNKNINKEIVLDNKTYNILLDAYNKSKESENYSIFASPFYSYWSDVFQMDDEAAKLNLDPLNDPITVDYLSTFASLIKDPNQIDLDIKENNKVTLKVSSEYLAKCEELEMVYPYISLNVLKSSYIIDEVMGYMNEHGYKNGILVSHDGVVSQGEYQEVTDYAIYEPGESGNINVATIKNLTSPNVSSSLYRFNLYNEKHPPCYTISKDGQNYYRSIYIDIDEGISNNAYFSSTVYKKGNKVLEATFINNELAAKTDINEVKTYLTNHGLENEMIVIDYHKADNTIYASKAIYNNVSLVKELGYNLVQF